MKVNCKLCGLTISSVDVRQKNRRREIQRKIAGHIVASHVETAKIITENVPIVMELFIQWMHLEVVNIPELDEETKTYKQEVVDQLLEILGFDMDEGEDEIEDKAGEEEVEEVEVVNEDYKGKLYGEVVDLPKVEEPEELEPEVIRPMADRTD